MPKKPKQTPLWIIIVNLYAKLYTNLILFLPQRTKDEQSRLYCRAGINQESCLIFSYLLTLWWFLVLYCRVINKTLNPGLNTFHEMAPNSPSRYMDGPRKQITFKMS